MWCCHAWKCCSYQKILEVGVLPESRNGSMVLKGSQTSQTTKDLIEVFFDQAGCLLCEGGICSDYGDRYLTCRSFLSLYPSLAECVPSDPAHKTPRIASPFEG